MFGNDILRDSEAIRQRVVLGQAASPLTPIIATALWCVLFSAVALWRFSREEF